MHFCVWKFIHVEIACGFLGFKLLRVEIYLCVKFCMWNYCLEIAFVWKLLGTNQNEKIDKNIGQ